MKRYVNFYSITGTLFFLYVFARAITVGVTYDEAWTLMDFVDISVIDILTCVPCDANNHIINSLLVKFTYYFTPNNLFWGRFPNVVAFFFYILLSAKMSNRFLPKYLGYTLFVLLLANPFLLDFFSLSRGYGLGITFLMASVLGLFNFKESGKMKYAIAGIGWASVAVLCNYALLNYWFGAFFMVLFLAFTHKYVGLQFIKYIGISIGFAALLAAVMYIPITKLLAQDGLYFGGIMGFYAETVDSLTRYSLYDPVGHHLASFVHKILTGILIVVLVLGVSTYRSFKELINSNAVLISILVAIPILSNVMQRILVDTLYLVARTALFYYPLFMILIIFWMAEAKSKAVKKLMTFTAMSLAIAFVFNFLVNANFHKTITWEFDSHNREILTELQAKAEKENAHYTVGAVRLYIRGILYQIDDFPNLKYMPEQNIQDSVSSDFYIHYDKELMRIYYYGYNQEILTYDRDTVLEFPDDGVYVFSNFKKKEAD